MTTQLNVDVLNAALHDAPATTIIRQALTVARRPFVSTKFGPDSAVLLHLLIQQRATIPVVWIDTGFNTRATQHFAEQLIEQLDLNLKVFYPRQPWQGLPPTLDDPAHAAFTRQVKLEPFARALATLQPDLWFSSLRRVQTDHRNQLQPFSRTASGLLKVTPLLDWRDTRMDAYRVAHRLPSETDYYDPTKGEPRRECGLHLVF